MSDTNGFLVFTGNSNPLFAKNVCDYLGMELGKAKVGRFSDGEIEVEILENVRNKECFIIQSTCSSHGNSCNRNLMELLLMIDAMKRSSAKRITAVIPYYGYARQDKKVAPRVPISAKLVANMLQAAGANRIITMDLHAGQIQGFFDIPADNLFARPILIQYIEEKIKKEGTKLVAVSPDAGGVERALSWAKKLDADLAIISKKRTKPNESKVMALVGDVNDKIAVILDDMTDTSGTLTEAASKLLDAGALEVWAIVTHGVLSGPALDRIAASQIKELIVTDTIPLTDKAIAMGKIKTVPVYPLFAEAIKRSHTGDSVTELF